MTMADCRSMPWMETVNPLTSAAFPPSQVFILWDCRGYPEGVRLLFGGYGTTQNILPVILRPSDSMRLIVQIRSSSLDLSFSFSLSS